MLGPTSASIAEVVRPGLGGSSSRAIDVIRFSSSVGSLKSVLIIGTIPILLMGDWYSRTSVWGGVGFALVVKKLFLVSRAVILAVFVVGLREVGSLGFVLIVCSQLSPFASILSWSGSTLEV